MIPEAKITEIYFLTEDFCKEFASLQKLEDFSKRSSF
jgi:hypothetical protein